MVQVQGESPTWGVGWFTVLLRGLVLEDSRAWGCTPLWLPLLLGQSSGAVPRCCLHTLLHRTCLESGEAEMPQAGRVREAQKQPWCLSPP